MPRAALNPEPSRTLFFHRATWKDGREALRLRCRRASEVRGGQASRCRYSRHEHAPCLIVLSLCSTVPTRQLRKSRLCCVVQGSEHPSTSARRWSPALTSSALRAVKAEATPETLPQAGASSATFCLPKSALFYPFFRYHRIVPRRSRHPDPNGGGYVQGSQVSSDRKASSCCGRWRHRRALSSWQP